MAVPRGARKGGRGEGGRGKGGRGKGEGGRGKGEREENRMTNSASASRVFCNDPRGVFRTGCGGGGGGGLV